MLKWFAKRKFLALLTHFSPRILILPLLCEMTVKISMNWCCEKRMVYKVNSFYSGEIMTAKNPEDGKLANLKYTTQNPKGKKSMKDICCSLDWHS